MKTVVYVDVLLVVNAVLNYFLLLATAFFTREQKRRGRIALAAFAGSFFALAILLPAQGALLGGAVRLAGAALMAGVAFGARPARRLARNAVYLFICGALLAGALYALAQRSNAVLVRNQSVYIDLSPVTLVLAALGIYLALCAAGLLFRRPREQTALCAATVTTDFGSAEVRLLADTGNRLREAATGRGVVVLRRSLAARLLDGDALAALYAFEGGERSAESLARVRGFALVPFAAVSGAGLLLGFPARDLRLANGGRRGGEVPLVAFCADELLGGADGVAPAEELETE